MHANSSSPPATRTGWREDEVIASVLAAPGTPRDLIGDDTVALASRTGVRVWSVDLVVNRIHVDTAWWPLEAIAHKAVAVNLSDLAAAGAEPEAALLALACPAELDAAQLAHHVAVAAASFGSPLVGGDTSLAPTLALAVTVVGWSAAAPLTRAGARPGDAIVVTGPLGAAHAALRSRSLGTPPEAIDPALLRSLLWPTPRLREGRTAHAAGASAAMDVSDGFALDLGRLADRSGVGFRLEEVPVAEGASLDDALAGGEDYELIITTPELGALERAFADAGLAPPLRVGTVVADPGERTFQGKPLEPRGWVHGSHQHP